MSLKYGMGWRPQFPDHRDYQFSDYLETINLPEENNKPSKYRLGL